MSEYLTVLIIQFSGWALLRSVGMRGWGTVPLGFIAGTFLVVVSGFVFVIAGARTEPSYLLIALLLVGGAALLAVWREVRRPELALLAWVPIVLAGLVRALRDANLVSYHIDSFRYLTSSGLLAQNAFHEFATINLLTKRMLVAPVLHSLASGFGEDYLRSLTPLLALALVATLVWFLANAPRVTDGSRVPPTWLAATVMALLLVSMNRFVWNAFYLNAHLIVGIAFVVIAASAWLLAGRNRADNGALVALLVLAIPTLVVGRPEGFMLAGVAIVPLLLARSVAVTTRAAVLAVFGISTAGWYGHVSLAYGGPVPFEAYGPLVLGIIALAVIPVLVWQPLSRARFWLLPVMQLSLWFVLIGLAVRMPDILTRSLASTYQNVMAGAASWGASLAVVVGLVVIVVSWNRDADLASLRFPLMASLPLLLLLAFLRGGAFRVGDGDSLNRMFIQVIPLAVLYLAAASRSSRWGLPTWRRDAGGRGRAPASRDWSDT